MIVLLTALQSLGQRSKRAPLVSVHPQYAARHAGALFLPQKDCNTVLVLQAEASVPIVLDAVTEQVSRAAAGQSLLAAAQTSDAEAAAAAALEAAFPMTGIAADHAKEAAGLPHAKKIIYEGDLIDATAAGINTGANAMQLHVSANQSAYSSQLGVQTFVMLYNLQGTLPASAECCT